MTVAGKKWAGAYVTLDRYMTRDLGLKGTELLVFAAIDGFARSRGECTSTMGYFSFWSGRCRRSCGQAVASLTEKDLVERGWRLDDTGWRVTYRLTDLSARRRGDRDGEGESVTLRGRYVTELGLTGVDLVTYAALAELCPYGSERPVALSWLASWSGSSRETVRRAVSRLEQAGLVARRAPESAGGPNVYGLAATVSQGVTRR